MERDAKYPFAMTHAPDEAVDRRTLLRLYDEQGKEVARLRTAMAVLSKASWDAIDVRCYALDALNGGSSE
jgi:hypothetical protein